MRRRVLRFAGVFVLTLLVFVAINLLAAHVMSDCGLRAVFGRSGCADDIRRAGFPLLFMERGGLVGRNVLNPSALLFDLACGIGAAVLAGWLAARR